MSDTPLTIYQAMAKILADIDYIGKDRKADMGNAGKYNFRGIDDIYNALHSSFAKHKVFLLPKVLDSKIETIEKEKTYNGVISKTYTCSAILTIEFTFVSEDGSSVTAIGIGQALDQSDKATNKAQSAALKYCLMQTFLIPTEESKDIEDDNISIARSTHQSASQQPPGITQYQSDLKKAFEILNWDRDRKAAWAKGINPAPFANWGESDYRRALAKAQVAMSEESKVTNAIEDRLDAIIGTKDGID
jgi:hypothetical protein